MKTGSLVALLFVLLCGNAEANWEKTWQRFEVAAHLDNAGTATIVQRMAAKLEGNMDTLEVPLSTGPDQAIVLRRFVREDGDSEHELSEGDPYQRDHYDFTDGVLRWCIKPVENEWHGETVVFRVEYELRNALDPAWDIPIGRAHFAEWSEFWKFPARFRDACRAWQDAGSQIARRYRYEHEITFPAFPATGPIETNYTLKFDEAWRQVHPDVDLGRGLPEGYRVTQLMEFLPPGRPSAFEMWKPAVRAGSIVAVVAAAIFLSLFFLLKEVRKIALQGPRIEAAWFAENIARQPPELLARKTGYDYLASCFPHFLARMRNAGVLSIQTEPAATEDGDGKVSLRLLRNPAGMQPYEKQVIESLFPSGNESGTDVLAKHYAESGFNPEETLTDAVADAIPKAVSTSPHARVFAPLQVLLFCVGVPLVFYHVFHGDRDWRLCFNSLGIAFGISVIPFLLHVTPAWRDFKLAPLIPVAWWGLGTALFVAVNFGTNLPLNALACAGLAMCWIAAFGTMLSVATTDDIPGLAPEDRHLALAAKYARRELQHPHPALSNAWLPHLRALGLGPEIGRWRKRPAAGPASDFPDRESQPSGLPPFTGIQPPQPESEWAEALYVLSKEDAREMAEEMAEDEKDDGKSA